MTIHVATDHAGFSHKEAVVVWLQAEGFTVVDHGAFALDENDDFTDFVAPAAAAVSREADRCRGIVFGGSGQGEAMLANRFRGVRATVYYGGDDTIPVLSRQHNDANVLSIGARFIDIDTTKRIIWEWLHATAFTDEKYQRRNRKIDELSN